MKSLSKSYNIQIIIIVIIFKWMYTFVHSLGIWSISLSGSRWTLRKNIDRMPAAVEQLRQECHCENQLADCGLYGPQWPMVEQPQPRCERSAAMVKRRTWVNIAVHPCLHSFLTHNKYHLFENKMWQIYIFVKKCIRSLLNSFITG